MKGIDCSDVITDAACYVASINHRLQSIIIFYIICREGKAIARPKSFQNTATIQEVQVRADNTNGDCTHHQQKSSLDDLLGLGMSLFALEL